MGLTFCDPLFGPWTFPGMDTGVGCHFLLQGIFPTLVSNPGLPQLQADSLSSEPPGKPKGWEHCFFLLTPIHIRHISLQYSALNLHTWDKLNLSMKEVVWKWSCSLVYDSLQLHGLHLPSSYVHGIFQARVLEWVAISFSSSLCNQWHIHTAHYNLGVGLDEVIVRRLKHSVYFRNVTWLHQELTVVNKKSAPTVVSLVGVSVKHSSFPRVRTLCQ